ncbi:FTR1 family iron permease [Lysinibacillus antri]|uniref:Transporter n=1 Tax=Lysinibacillus antri TaxID=2498145 RepID=A0A3S0P609_9BACI|nr:FTR1 family protein [Lysinibacillus antri]RUL53081.1 transporter [Lysinibacillus antri]
MKLFSQLCSLIFCVVLFVSPTYAETSYSEYYISITDALINTKQGNDEAAINAIEKFSSNWAHVSSTETEAKQVVDDILLEVQNAASAEERQTALSSLSKALSNLEKLENPVDKEQQRSDFKNKFSPVMEMFEEALTSQDISTITQAYNEFDKKWNLYERPIREESIGMYGQIETQMSFIRITLASEEPDLSLVQSQYETLKTTIEQFIAGEDVEVAQGEYSLQTLIDLMNDAEDSIDNGEFTEASDLLKEFIIVWPNVEMEVSTRNGSLYTAIESKMPILVSELLKESPNYNSVKDQLSQFKTEISLLQDHTSYSFWDSALILLREGLEALLIIMVLVSFLRKSNQNHMTKWIYTGALAGVVLSILAAVMLSAIFNSLSVNTSREMLEGYVGLIAAAMMIGVGIWLHNKSTVKSWNAYLSKQLGNAISKQSIFAMAMISFLSVFREGAETVIFYVGVAPKMPIFDFVLGIILAIAILIVVGLVMFKLSLKIPVHKFFFLATIFIYLLAFKIIGTSIHTLQLTDVIPSNVLHQLPVISSIGFYPTIETLIGQILLLVISIAVAFRQKLAKTI